MSKIPNKVQKQVRKDLQEHANRAWEIEMHTALGALAEQFDRWRAGTLSTAELDQAVHAHHNGVARAIWRRYSGSEPELPLARAVALGIVARESLPPEVLEYLARLVDLFARDPSADG